MILGLQQTNILKGTEDKRQNDFFFFCFPVRVVRVLKNAHFLTSSNRDVINMIKLYL